MTETIKKPIYKRAWFIVLAVIGVFALIGSMGDDAPQTAARSTAPAPAAATSPAPAPAAPATVTQAPPPASRLTGPQRNALRAANSYLTMSAFSRQGLIDQLVYEKYSVADATAAVDALDAPDWNAHAARAAAGYLKMSGHSCQGLIDQLKYEKYTTEQATAGATRAGAC